MIQSVHASEIRDSTLGGDTGTTEKYDIAVGINDLLQFLNLFVQIFHKLFLLFLMRITKILKILFPYRLQAGGSSNNRQIFEHLQQNVDATGVEAVDELLHVFGKPCGKQATAETQQNGTEQNPTGQDPQFEIFCVPMEKSMDHADGQHTKGKQCQQEHGLSQQLIDGVALIQKRYHTGTVDLIEII